MALAEFTTTKKPEKLNSMYFRKTTFWREPMDLCARYFTVKT